MRRALALILVCGVAHAQPSRREAGEHFKAGEQARAEGRYRDAIAEYDEAYALLPHANALYNIAFCYEKLGEWSQAADYYERYLAEPNNNATDRPAVTEKITVLRDKAHAARRDEPDPWKQTPGPRVGTTAPPPDGPPIGTTVQVPTPAEPFVRWHLGAAYGIGVGDAPIQRFLAFGGLRLSRFVELDAIGGAFGKNDYAIGGVTRILLPGSRVATPFLRGAVTIGRAKQDASSTADTKFPLGFEVGGGVQLGSKRGHFEADAVIRWVRGGWDAMSTTADSYVNDELAVALDIGFAFDISGGGR